MDTQRRPMLLLTGGLAALASLLAAALALLVYKTHPQQLSFLLPVLLLLPLTLLIPAHIFLQRRYPRLIRITKEGLIVHGDFTPWRQISIPNLHDDASTLAFEIAHEDDSRTTSFELKPLFYKDALEAIHYAKKYILQSRQKEHPKGT